MIEDLIDGIACYCDTLSKYSALQNMYSSLRDVYDDSKYDDSLDIRKLKSGLPNFIAEHKVSSILKSHGVNNSDDGYSGNKIKHFIRNTKSKDRKLN
jgi:hypothetical protein